MSDSHRQSEDAAGISFSVRSQKCFSPAVSSPCQRCGGQTLAAPKPHVSDLVVNQAAHLMTGDSVSLKRQDSNFKPCSILQTAESWTKMKTDIDLALRKNSQPLAKLCFRESNVHTPLSLGSAMRQKTRTMRCSSNKVSHIFIQIHYCS